MTSGFLHFTLSIFRVSRPASRLFFSFIFWGARIIITLSQHSFWNKFHLTFGKWQIFRRRVETFHWYFSSTLCDADAGDNDYRVCVVVNIWVVEPSTDKSCQLPAPGSSLKYLDNYFQRISWAYIKTATWPGISNSCCSARDTLGKKNSFWVEKKKFCTTREMISQIVMAPATAAHLLVGHQ